MQHFPHLAVALTFAAAAFAQSPLTTIYAANNGGSVGGAFYFDLEVRSAVEFTRIDLNISARTPLGTAGCVDIYLGCVPSFSSPNHQSAAEWHRVATATGISAPPDVATICPLAQPLHLPAGDYTIALVLDRWSHAYTTGIGGTSTFSNNELSLTTGGASNVPFAGTQFHPRIWNGALHYSTSPSVPATAVRCAQAIDYGQGCYSGASSFYEGAAALSAFDLRGDASGLPGTENTIVLTAIGQAGYTVSQGSSNWFPPLGLPVRSQSLGVMSDDTMSEPLPVPSHWNGFTGTWPHSGGAVSQFHACSNGYVVVGATTAVNGDWSPSVAEFLTTAGEPNTARLAPCWADL
ncbi:MAG: hypothetical protein KDC98_12600, partial [Planctomycetes bacterium]|nr:hypothetical protein [Planctomycetota bacterium]